MRKRQRAEKEERDPRRDRKIEGESDRVSTSNCHDDPTTHTFTAECTTSRGGTTVTALLTMRSSSLKKGFAMRKLVMCMPRGQRIRFLSAPSEFRVQFSTDCTDEVPRQQQRCHVNSRGATSAGPR